MKIVVLIKEVPDTYGQRQLSLETGLTERAAEDSVIDEITERALELALKYAESVAGTEVVVMSMGPSSAVSALRRGLAMGASSATHILDDRLIGADLGTTSHVLSTALRRGEFDVVIMGCQSTDGAAGLLPAMLAEHLKMPHLTRLSSVVIQDDLVLGTQISEDGVAKISSPLPAVISVTESMPEARFPNLKGIRAANKKPFETISLEDLGCIEEPNTGLPRSIMISASKRPTRQSGTKIVDEGDGGSKLAAFLIERRLA